MKGHTKGPALDISIRGDELEQHRIQLENNLQQTDLSFRLSSASDDENNNYYHNDSSVEYPRHDSGPSPFPEFPSFAHQSRDFYGEEETHDQIHGWSYRTGDDDEGINPYGGGTMSTAAHHASALTLNAGLGGTRREISMSGAEYDPDRPLNQIMAGVGRMSMFDMDPSGSKINGLNSVAFDPLVVDTTEELDRILQSGYAPHASRSCHPTPPMSAASSSISDFDNGRSPTTRPKLSDHLKHVSFSPKRPRSGQSHRPTSPVSRTRVQNGSPITRKTLNSSIILNGANDSMNMPTPRPSRRSNIIISDTPSIAQPEVRLQPPTPSTVSSNFTRMARGITKEIAQNQSQDQLARPPSAPLLPAHRPKTSHQNATQTDFHVTRHISSRRGLAKENSKSKIVLPDITGLTSAVESPAKPGKDYRSYRSNNTPRDSEVRLLQTLSNVQSKLQHLNEENGISRRRVRELEMELDECKREVARERTRLLEREDVIVQQQRDLIHAAGRSRTKGKTKEASVETEDMNGRYKEVVEEKKALEALINSLRSHLTRLTSELASHQELLVELRSLRDSDSRSLQEKGAEVVRLKEEVERLAGEVEVLRGVVEEGLRERRASKEVSTQAMEADLEEEDEDHDSGDNGGDHQDNRCKSDSLELNHLVEESDEETEPFDPSSIRGSSRANIGHGDKTMRTDHATLGSSSNFALSTSSVPRVQFIGNQEFERIAAEVEERRSDRSLNGSISVTSDQDVPSPVRGNMRQRPEKQDDSFYISQPPSPVPAYQNQPGHQPIATPQLTKTEAPRPNTNVNEDSSRSKRDFALKLETPFPRIRGDHLERLFFSAPEHNPKTCTVCYRRRRRRNPQDHDSVSSIPPREPKRSRNVQDAESSDENEDEGFEEGPEVAAESEAVPQDKKSKRRDGYSSVDPRYFRKTAQRAGLPPQTVVTRVIRELEDDFTHYKSIYVELADQYKDMDAVSDVSRRNTLAQHLREVVDTLEQKGDQIASLYDLLTFKDKPDTESIVPSRRSATDVRLHRHKEMS